MLEKQVKEQSRNTNPSVQIQIKPKSQREFVPRDTEKSEFFDAMDFGVIAISMETVVHTTYFHGYGVASVSRIDQIIGFFCKRAL